MFRLAFILAPLAAGRLRSGARNAKRRAGLIALAAVAALIGAAFILVGVTVALARAIGVLPALAVMAGVALLIAVGLVVAMKIGDDRRREKASALSKIPTSAYSSVLARALSSPRSRGRRGGSALGLGLLGLGAVVLVLASLAGSGDDDG